MRIASFSGGEALAAKLKELIDKAGQAGTLRVGFLEGATYPDKNSTPVASVAAIQEFGAPAAGIPARPFFRNMIADKSPGWGEKLGKTARRNGYDMRATLESMGAGIKKQLQESIQTFDAVPLADSTIDRKGFDKQLIDTSHMINSVDYDVKI